MKLENDEGELSYDEMTFLEAKLFENRNFITILFYYISKKFEFLNLIFNRDKYESIYGEKSKDASISENSENFSLRNTNQSELFSTPEKYSNIHFFCKGCGCIPTIEFISILNFIYTCGCIKKCPIKIKDIIKFFENTLILEKNEEKDIIKPKKNNIQ
jgi:hypothetical protein